MRDTYLNTLLQRFGISDLQGDVIRRGAVAWSTHHEAQFKEAGGFVSHFFNFTKICGTARKNT
jgi:hypothetical protein